MAEERYLYTPIDIFIVWATVPGCCFVDMTTNPFGCRDLTNRRDISYRKVMG